MDVTIHYARNDGLPCQIGEDCPRMAGPEIIICAQRGDRFILNQHSCRGSARLSW